VIIADTNLLVCLLVEADQTQGARACAARDPFWQAPGIWRHEFINALSQHVRLRGLRIQDAMEALAVADELVDTTTLRGFDERVIAVASSLAIASYDAEFLVAAEIADVPLVTADKRLVEASKGRAISIADFAAGR
jgi:predicted nucleic acid-binding protein